MRRKTAQRVPLTSVANNPEIDRTHVRMRLAIELYRRKRGWNRTLVIAVFDYDERLHSDPHPNPLPEGEGGRRPGEGI